MTDGHQIQCTACKELITLPITFEEIKVGLSDMSRNIQEIFPTLTDGQREMLKTGICDTCWEKLFEGGEEE